MVAFNSTMLVSERLHESQLGEGIRRIGKGQARHLHNRDHRHRRDLPSRARAVPVGGRDQDHGIPYRGASQAITDILGGTLDGLFGDVPTVLSQIRGGKLKALAATSSQRSDIFPDVPTFVEQGFAGTVADQWAGVVAPRARRRP